MFVGLYQITLCYVISLWITCFDTTLHKMIMILQHHILVYLQYDILWYETKLNCILLFWIISCYITLCCNMCVHDSYTYLYVHTYIYILIYIIHRYIYMFIYAHVWPIYIYICGGSKSLLSIENVGWSPPSFGTEVLKRNSNGTYDLDCKQNVQPEKLRKVRQVLQPLDDRPMARFVLFLVFWIFETWMES